ncbi:MAG: hypothetical protein ABI446_03270 [Gemmatimonadaceae bacterium]
MPPPDQSAHHEVRGTRPTPLAMLIVALVAVAPYLATIGYGFVYDDGPIIADNPALHDPAGMLTAWHVAYWPAAWGRAGLFRPVVQFMYALLWNVSGGAPWLFHLYAVLLYAACALAVMWVLARALSSRAAFLGALLFAAHPLHVESVANIAGSAEIVAALASIACVLAIVRAFDDGDGTIAWKPAIASALLFAVAVGAKESAATVPALVALVVWGWRDTSEAPIRARAILVRGWRVWTAYVIVLLVMLAARRAVLGGFSPPATALAVGLDGETLVQRWWTMTGAWPLIAQLLVAPTRLSMHYGPTTVIPHHVMNRMAVVSIVALAIVILASVALARRGDRRPFVAIGWAALGYLAASNILVPTGQLLAERTLFFSSVGIVMVAGWGLARIERLQMGTQLVAAALALVVVASGLVETRKRVPVWSSEERLFQSGIDYDPDAFYPYWQLARSVGRHGDNARGLSLLGDAYRRYPEGETLALELAQHLRMSDRGEEALMVLRATTEAHPHSQPARLAFLDALLDRRGADSVIVAIDGFQNGVRGPDPAGSLRYVLLARAYEKLGRTDSVSAVYARAVAEDGGDPGLRYAYAMALLASHRDVDAQRELDSAAASGEMPPAAQFALQARISLDRGDSAGARIALARARVAAPTDTGLAALDSALRRGTN